MNIIFQYFLGVLIIIHIWFIGMRLTQIANYLQTIVDLLEKEEL